MSLKNKTRFELLWCFVNRLKIVDFIFSTSQIVVLPKENVSIPLKLRVFVKASLEAKALNDYFSRNTDQNPAPFVMLSRGLHMIVAYDMTVLDPSDASVADRFRYFLKVLMRSYCWSD
jgi:hypothetical protein